MDLQSTSRTARLLRTGDLSRLLVALALVSLAAGVWLRFSAVPAKYVYRDEVWTSMHIAGKSIDDVRALKVQHTTSGALVRTFQTPASGSSSLDTVRVLAGTDPQHPPLYYLLARLWAKAGGATIVGERVLSVCFGILLIAAMYWLTLLLFKKNSAALLCAALVAASPYQAVFAGEVREWSLFMLLAVLATALLVRALDAPATGNWIAYAVAMTLTAYCSVLSLGIFVAHAIAVPALRSQGVVQRRFAASAGIAFVLYLPWLIDMGLQWGRATNNAAYAALATSPAVYAAKLVFTLGTFVFDAEYVSLRWALVALVAMAAAIYGIFVFARQAPERARWIVFALGAVPLAFFVLSDLALHSSRALQARYLLMTCICVQLAVAYALTAPAGRRSITTLRTCAAAFLLIAGIASLWVARRHAAWWDNNDSAPMASAAAIAARTPGSVVLFDDTFAALLFSNQADPETQLAFNVDSAVGKGVPAYGLDLHPATLARLRSIPGLRAESLHLPGAQTALHGAQDDSTTLWRFTR